MKTIEDALFDLVIDQTKTIAQLVDWVTKLQDRIAKLEEKYGK